MKHYDYEKGFPTKKKVLYAYELQDWCSENHRVGNILHGSVVFFPKQQSNILLIPRPEFNIYMEVVENE